MPSDLVKKLSEKSIHVFLEAYQITNDAGHRLDFKDHPYLWQIYEDFTPKQAILKAAQVGLCLSPETKVLTTDYRWVEIDKIREGDRLISVDEDHNGGSQGRKKRVAIVEGKREVFEDAIKLTLEDGTILSATLGHRFLSKRRGAVDTLWRETKDFVIGDTIRYFCDVWDEGDFEDGWMGGFLDGEGSLRRKGGSELTMVQTEGAVLERARKYFEEKGYSHRAVLRTTKRGLGRKPIWEITTSNTAEIYKIIGQTRPARFACRTNWWEGACIGRDKKKQAWCKVVGIESIGRRRMIDIQTSTRTFIANGYISHNSTTINLKALWLAKNRGMDIIYSLPSAADVKEFVSGKTNRLIDFNPIFQEWTSDKDSIEQKRVGNNVIYWRGSWTERAAISIPADLYISDETDRSKQEIVTQYATRLQHSEYAWEWYLSNPSVPGVGVDKHWAKSDQKHWFVKCEGCNHNWYMTLDNIMLNAQGVAYYGCTKCKKELNRRKGEWVRRHNDKDVSGYWIPLLIAPRLSAEYVLNKKREMSEEQFSNFVLGQPYIGKGNVLTKPMFLQNIVNTINPQDSRPIIGVDTGVGINYVVGNKHGIFFNDKCNDYGPIRNLLQRWPNAICVIDQGGDIIGPRKLREEFPHRVFLCFFRQDRKNDQLIQWNDNDGTVVADRNKLIQLCVDEFVEKRMPVYGTEADWYDYMIEWVGMYRTTEENTLGVPVSMWHKPASGRCDFPFAQVYMRIGLDRFLETSSTFHEATQSSFAFQGVEVQPNGTTFLPKRI